MGQLASNATNTIQKEILYLCWKGNARHLKTPYLTDLISDLKKFEDTFRQEVTSHIQQRFLLL